MYRNVKKGWNQVKLQTTCECTSNTIRISGVNCTEHTLYTIGDLFAITAPLCLGRYFPLTLATPSTLVWCPTR